MTKKQTKGFTIIEVVLVLAIAGLIFLMVFVAVPTLQRSQRDTRRREDLSRVSSAIIQYQTNNDSAKSNLPAAGTWSASETYPDNCSKISACRFIRDYMNSATEAENGFKDPDDVFYNLVITENLAQGDLTTIKLSAAEGGDGEGGDGTSTSYLEQTDEGYTIAGQNPFSSYVIYMIPGGKCNGEYVVKAERRRAALLYRLEGSGVYCLDDQ